MTEAVESTESRRDNTTILLDEVRELRDGTAILAQRVAAVTAEWAGVREIAAKQQILDEKSAETVAMSAQALSEASAALTLAQNMKPIVDSAVQTENYKKQLAETEAEELRWRTRARVLSIAVIVLVLVLGAVGGWVAFTVLGRSSENRQASVASARASYQRCTTANANNKNTAVLFGAAATLFTTLSGETQDAAMAAAYGSFLTAVKDLPKPPAPVSCNAYRDVYLKLGGSPQLLTVPVMGATP